MKEETLRLVRIFIASPGDLGEERQAIKELEKEFNTYAGFATYLGFRIEIDGWEDTLSGSGRPQAIINKELELCELFIGMMNRKWGTPPSSGGKYTSGFEEEYCLSTERLRKTGKPEMAMYFKKVSDEFLKDPGSDLQKVLEFKKRIASERSLYHEEFEDSNQLQQRIRLKIQQYLISLKEIVGQDRDNKKSKTIKLDDDKKNEALESPFSQEGHFFLTELLEKTENNPESLSSVEIARFRLLSTILSGPDNDKQFLGVHDANIIFSRKNEILGKSEISRLIDCGLLNIKNENVPFWHWCKIYQDTYSANGYSILAIKALIYSDEEIGRGALAAMNLIGEAIPEKVGFGLSRRNFLEEVLSESQSSSTKLEMLGYLKNWGLDVDLPLILKEVDIVGSKSSRSALEAIVAIQLRYSENEALSTAFKNQFEYFDKSIIRQLLIVIDRTNEESLTLGLRHKNEEIRLGCLRRLIKIGELNTDQIEDLKIDPYARIRKEVINYIISTGQPLNDQEAKSILVRPNSNRGLKSALLGHNIIQSDKEGEACYEDYLLSKHLTLRKKPLFELVQSSSIFNYTPYFALCDKYFKSYSEVLRKDIDENFNGRFKDYLVYLKELDFDEEFIESTSLHEAALRKELTRKALDLLCNKGNANDLERVRKIMRSDYVESSSAEIKYFQKHGKWEDIPYILDAKNFYRSPTSLLSPSEHEWPVTLAKALYAIGKNRIEELLNMEIPNTILLELIKACSSSKFSELAEATHFKILNNSDEDVRKYATLKIIQSFNKSKISSYLTKYIDNQEYRYYNVIYWLDFGTSMPKPKISQAISLIYGS